MSESHRTTEPFQSLGPSTPRSPPSVRTIEGPRGRCDPSLPLRPCRTFPVGVGPFLKAPVGPQRVRRGSSRRGPLRVRGLKQSLFIRFPQPTRGRTPCLDVSVGVRLPGKVLRPPCRRWRRLFGGTGGGRGPAPRQGSSDPPETAHWEERRVRARPQERRPWSGGPGPAGGRRPFYGLVSLLMAHHHKPRPPHPFSSDHDAKHFPCKALWM